MLKHLLLSQLLLCLCIIHTNAAPQTSIRSIAPKSDKYGIIPNRDFIGDMCKLLDNTFQMVPWPVRTDGICDNLGLNTPRGEAKYCPMFKIAKMFMGYLQASYPMQCAADSIPMPSSVEVSSAGHLLPTPFPSLLSADGLPAVFSDETTAHLLKTEGPSYYWHYKHITRLTAWAPCDAMGWGDGGRSSFAVPNGWSLMHVIHAGTDLSTYEIQATMMPFAAIMRRPASAEVTASCKAFLRANAHRGVSARRAARLQNSISDLCSGDEVAVLVRGTATASDWGYNLDMAMVQNSNYGAGKIHRGFQNLADTLWNGGLKQALDQVMQTASSVTISGHSLGGAAAALLAARAQKHLTSGRSSAQLTAVLYGTPNVGDATFSSDFNSRVNVRNIQFFADMVTQVPCEGSMIQCTQGSETSAAGGEVSGNTTIMSYPYARLAGRIVLRGKDMPLQSDAWDMLGTYTQDDFCDNMQSIGSLVEATHICSYMCALSDLNPDMRGDWCQLWQNIDQGARLKAVGASFCMAGFNFMSDQGDFPTFPMFPSYKTQEWLAQQPMRRGPQNKESRPAWAMPQPGTGESVTGAPASEHAHHG